MSTTNKLEYKGLVAWVEVDKEPTQCYSPDVDRKEKNVTCWIASEESRCFAVNFSASDPMCSLHLRLYLDGKRVSQKFYDRNSTKAARIRIADCWTSDTTYRPFIFAPLNTTDDEAYLERTLLSKDHAKKIGEITLTVNRIVNLRITRDKVPFPSNGSMEDTKETIPKMSKVHEKTMKAAMTHHQVSYGEKVDVKHKQKQNADGTVNQKVIHGNTKELIASFTFRYRPLKVLRNLGKAPIPPPLPRVNGPSTQSPSNEALANIFRAPSTEMVANIPQIPIVLQVPPAQNQNPVPECHDMQPEYSIPLLTLPQSTPELPPPAILEFSGVPPVDLGSDDVDMKPPVVDIEGGGEDDGDDGEEILKALQELQARVQKRQETKKRKRQEAAAANLKSGDSTPSSSPSKKVKREVGPMVFFSPDETKEVIDLTSC